MLHHGWRQARNTAITEPMKSRKPGNTVTCTCRAGHVLIQRPPPPRSGRPDKEKTEEALAPPPCLVERYKNPRSAMEQVSGPATMMWSSTRMSTSANASRSFIVMSSSARLGSGFPDGWQCAKITAAAF